MWLDLNTCAVDLARGQVLRDGQSTGLTPLELGVLRALSQPPLRVWSRQELLEQVWQGGSGRALESTVRRLRQKLEADPGRPRHLCKRYGRGYELVPGGPSQGPSVAWIRRLMARGPVTLWGPPGCDLERIAQAAGVAAAKGPPEPRCPRVVLLQPLAPDGAMALLLEHLPRPVQDLEALVALGQGLPGPLRELAQRAGLRSAAELRRALAEAPAALLPQSAAEAAAFWRGLSEAQRAACAPLAAVQRAELPLAEALELLPQEDLEALHRAGALLRGSREGGTTVALPALLRHLARTEEGAQAHADWTLSACRALKLRLDGGEAVEGALLAWLPEVERALLHSLDAQPDLAVALLETVNTAARRQGQEQVLEGLQSAILPHTEGLSAQAASSFFQMRSERLRMAGELEAAVDFARRGLAQARLCGDPEELGLSLAQVAILHHHLGDYAQAGPIYQEALGVPGLAPRHRVTLLSNLASVQRALGQGDDAERTLRALLTHSGLGAAKRFGVHRALAFLYINRGEHEQAMEAHREMAPLLETRPASLDAAMLGMQRGLLALDRGTPLQALQVLTRAAETAHTLGEHRTQAMALDYAGAACVLLERPEQAQDYLRRSVHAYAQAGREGTAAWPLSWLVLSAREADPETAAALLRARELDAAAPILPVAEQHLALSQAVGARALREARQATRRRLDSLTSEVETVAEVRVAVRWLRARWALH